MARSRQSEMGAWPALAAQAWWLGAEASWVIWLRCMSLAAGGPNATREAERMVTEKWQAQLDLAAALATGRLGHDPASMTSRTLQHYGRRVRANRTRLSR